MPTAHADIYFPSFNEYYLYLGVLPKDNGNTKKNVTKIHIRAIVTILRLFHLTRTRQLRRSTQQLAPVGQVAFVRSIALSTLWKTGPWNERGDAVGNTYNWKFTFGCSRSLQTTTVVTSEKCKEWEKRFELRATCMQCDYSSAFNELCHWFGVWRCLCCCRRWSQKSLSA